VDIVYPMANKKTKVKIESFYPLRK